MNENDDTKIESAQVWISQQQAQGNSLAEAYSAMLQDAKPEVKKNYYLTLYEMIAAGKLVAESLRQN